MVKFFWQRTPWLNTLSQLWSNFSQPVLPACLHKPQVDHCLYLMSTDKMHNATELTKYMKCLIPNRRSQLRVGAQLGPKLIKCMLASLCPLKFTFLPKQLSDRHCNLSYEVGHVWARVVQVMIVDPHVLGT